MSLEEIRCIQAFDCHSHFGPVNCPAEEFPIGRLENGTTEFLLRQMEQANIGVSFNSSRLALMPRGRGDSIRGNALMLEEVNKLPNVYMWVVINPLNQDTYRQAAEFLQHPKVVGLKVHPDEQLFSIREYGDEIYSFAAKHKAVLLGHSGEPNSMPEEYCKFANQYPEVQTIAAHLGCGSDGDFDHQIRAIEMNKYGNLYTDTSTARSLMANIIEYAVQRIGSKKILFGTDSGIYFSPCQRIRIDCADIPEEDKRNILYRNSIRLFPHISLQQKHFADDQEEIE